MANTHKFFIPIKPTAKARARAFIRNGAIGHYTPQKTFSYEKFLKDYLKLNFKQQPYEMPILLGLVFKFKKPKSWTKSKKESISRHTSKPDLSNLIKAVEDAGNGVLYKDDSFISHISAMKIYSQEEGIEICVHELGHE